MAASQLEQFRHSLSLLRAMARDRAATNPNTVTSDAKSLLLEWAHRLQSDLSPEPQPETATSTS
jgi:hypothetical protein